MVRNFIATARALAVFCAVLGAASFATAKPPNAIGRIVSVEAAAEVTAAQVTLPATPDGILVVTRCGTCAPESFVVNATTRWMIGKDVVDLAALRAHVATNPRMALAVFYTADRRELKRVHASAR